MGVGDSLVSSSVLLLGAQWDAVCAQNYQQGTERKDSVGSFPDHFSTQRASILSPQEDQLTHLICASSLQTHTESARLTSGRICLCWPVYGPKLILKHLYGSVAVSYLKLSSFEVSLGRLGLGRGAWRSGQ